MSSYTSLVAARRVFRAAAGTISAFAALTGFAIAGFPPESDHEGSAGGLVYRSSTLQFAGAGDAIAACPDGRHVSGGGAFLDGSVTDGSIGGLAPDYISDEVSFKEAYAATGSVVGLGQNIKTFAICAPAKDVEYRKKTDPFTTMGVPVELKARCPAGTHVTGGGIGRTGGGSNDNLLISAPYDGGDKDGKPDDGWRGRLVPTNTAQVVTLRAICSDALHLSYRREETTDSGTLALGAGCPTDSVATGGGVELTGDDGPDLHASIPNDFGDTNTTPEDGWFARANASSTRTMTVHAICSR